ncbi:uncharacterized protein LACBIDRAFT_316791 [Laccaria bicolor S238N-H82]|uniref:Predicted protein n=1 Tax=Laccaria bicolor (strain S238N-H82 / ATCC MYA-4686) TaxID=486041 RepID=B0E1M4_LACBS|nr:uncharacterized protein LACBIDRAFT_316791 [Laccaria bicolor S238N-H82]EDQ99291.1 predicted protein [Laccaria bicolor S238N-H82]|eukprot:XP_001890101.1 predicted protein [Laccaria bicolor S238N-H82]
MQPLRLTPTEHRDQKKQGDVWSSCAVHSSSDPPDRPLENCGISENGGVTQEISTFSNCL